MRSLARRAKRGAPGLGPGDGGSLPGLHATSFGGQQINPAPLSTRRFCPSRGDKPAFGHQATLQEARAVPESACQHVGNRTTAVRKDFTETGHRAMGDLGGRWGVPGFNPSKLPPELQSPPTSTPRTTRRQQRDRKSSGCQRNRPRRVAAGAWRSVTREERHDARVDCELGTVLLLLLWHQSNHQLPVTKATNSIQVEHQSVGRD